MRESRRYVRRRRVKASGEAGAPGPDNTSEDGGKRKGRGRVRCRNDLYFLRTAGQLEEILKSTEVAGGC
jgi:hypothetical protein